MVAMFNTPKGRNHLYIFCIYLAFLLIAFLSSCKSRKVDKTFNKQVNKSEQVSEIKKTTERKDSKGVKVKADVKESTESNNTFDTETNTVINYDTLGRIKNAVINQKSKGQKMSKTNKSDNSITDFNFNHSEIINLDSTGKTQNKFKVSGGQRKLESKTDWLKIGVGAGVFILILFAGFMGYKRLRR